MLREKSVMKTFLTLVLSATMALPLTSNARNDNFTGQPGVMDDVPVMIGKAMVNGEEVNYFVAAVAPEEESNTVREWIKARAADPDSKQNTILVINDASDPALKAAASSGLLRRVSTYAAGKTDYLPILSDSSNLPASEKKTLRERLKKITESSKYKKGVGLMFGLAHAGIRGGFAAYASGSVEAGAAVFTMFSLCNSFFLLKNKVWGQALDAVGKTFVKFAHGLAGLTGQELSDRDARLYEVFGKFGLSLVVSASQDAFVKGITGEFSGLSGVHMFLSATTDGALNNYNIWDAVVLKNNAQGGWFTDKKTDWYFRLQMLAGAVAESLLFIQFPGVALGLFAVTTTGVFYMALNPDKQLALQYKPRELYVALRSGIVSISGAEGRRHINRSLARRIAGGWKSAKKKCQDLLAPAPARTVYQRYSYGDTQ